jgi:hypothetical protein
VGGFQPSRSITNRDHSLEREQGVRPWNSGNARSWPACSPLLIDYPQYELQIDNQRADMQKGVSIGNAMNTLSEAAHEKRTKTPTTSLSRKYERLNN